MARERVVVVPDPQHDYAVGLIRAFEQRHGLRTVAVFTNRRLELANRAHYPLLEGPVVAARYCVEHNLDAFCTELQRRFEVVGIAPYAEQCVELCAHICSALHLPWNDLAVLERFRDKQALKAFLAAADPGLPLGHFRRVESVQDVLKTAPPARYVLKLTNGFANRDIGFFSADTPPDQVESYLRHTGPGVYVMEERFSGREFAINGMVDAQGVAQVWNIVEYHRTTVNGIENVYHRQTHVPPSKAAFQPLSEYAQRVMLASGLRRCPFHMEAFLTPDGPRLIEVGARPPGSLTALQAAELHGFDLYAQLSDLYVFNARLQPAPLNWPRCEEWNAFSYDGHATRTERIFSLEGVEDVERHDDFRRWVFKPKVGAMVQRTVDLYSIPYSFQLLARRTDAQLMATADDMAAAIKWNRVVRRRDRVRVSGVGLLQRVAQRASWELERRRHSLPGSGLMDPPTAVVD